MINGITHDIYHTMKDAGIKMPDNVKDIDIHIGVDCIPTITYKTSADKNTMDIVLDALAKQIDGLEIKEGPQ
jgi:hypothetical protein